MCGIGAIVSLSEEQVRDGLPRMIVAMRHRGPDANGSALLNSPEVCCGLASTRLATSSYGASFAMTESSSKAPPTPKSC